MFFFAYFIAVWTTILVVLLVRYGLRSNNQVSINKIHSQFVSFENEKIKFFKDAS
jgi:hypothetical protein